MWEEKLDQVIEEAQSADEFRFVRWLCFIKNFYQSDTRKQAGRRVVDREIPTHRWTRAWNDDGVDGLRPRFGSGRPPKLTPT